MYNMTREEAERLGVRPGRKFEHYYLNNKSGKPEHRITGKITKLHKFFFMAAVKGKNGAEHKECFQYYLLKNRDLRERLYIKE